MKGQRNKRPKETHTSLLTPQNVFIYNDSKQTANDSMGRRIDPHAGPIELFFVQASDPRLV